MKKAIFLISYLGPVQYYAHLMNSEQVILEKHCNYTKQTYRNRCNIFGANGILSLTIPVDKQNKTKCKSKDVRMSYDTPWNTLHWKSITSAYNSSPYFEYYMDDFYPFYEKKHKYLFDFNVQLMEVIFDIIGIHPNVTYSEEYITDTNSENYFDYREIIHPKKDYKINDPMFLPVTYRQLFTEKNGFIPNLSIIDLIFNKGPESLIILKQSLRD